MNHNDKQHTTAPNAGLTSALLALTFALALPSCGGGGNDDKGNQNPPTGQEAIWDEFDWDAADWS